MTPNASKRWKRVGLVVLAIVAIQLLLDGLHAGYVAWTASRWEATVERDTNGVLTGCEAYELAPADGSTNNAAVLLVHGINASPRHYDLIAPALAERGYAVRVMRLPGFCEPLPRYAKTTSEQWVAAVTEELAALRETHRQVGLVGHSLGGAVSIGTLLENPDAADYAVLLAPAVAVSDARSPVLSTRSWHEFAQAVFVFTRTLSSPFAMDCHDESRHGHPGGVPFTPVAVVDSLFALMDQNLTAAERFETPVAMLLSNHDRVINTQAAADYFQRMASTEKELIRLENCGHEVPLDHDWPAVVEAIERLAKRTSGDKASSISREGEAPAEP